MTTDTTAHSARPRPTACPICGGAEYIVRLRVSGFIEERRGFVDGAMTHNSELWDSVTLRPFKRIRCADCDAVVKGTTP